jgi:hypothetical protein
MEKIWSHTAAIYVSVRKSCGCRVGDGQRRPEQGFEGTCRQLALRLAGFADFDFLAAFAGFSAGER